MRIFQKKFVSLQRPTKNNDPMKELYFADQNRYDNGMEYERCGRSGVLLPQETGITDFCAEKGKCVKAVPFDEAL